MVVKSDDATRHIALDHHGDNSPGGSIARVKIGMGEAGDDKNFNGRTAGHLKDEDRFSVPVRAA